MRAGRGAGGADGCAGRACAVGYSWASAGARAGPSNPPPTRTRSLTLALETRSNIAFLGSGLLLANYAAAITLALRCRALWNPWAMAGGHALLAVVLLWKTVRLDAAGYSQQAIKDYYGAIWWVTLAAAAACSAAGEREGQRPQQTASSTDGPVPLRRRARSAGGSPPSPPPSSPPAQAQLLCRVSAAARPGRLRCHEHGDEPSTPPHSSDCFLCAPRHLPPA